MPLDSSLASLYFLEEVTWGEIPAIALQTMRFTSESLGQQTQTVRSAEIVPTGDDSDIVRTSISASGDVNGEFSYATYDKFLSAGLRTADFPTQDSVAGTTISAASADNSYNDSANGFAVFEVGQYVKVSGFATAANNGWARIVSVAAGKIVVTGLTLVVEAVGPSVTIKSSFIKNGVTKRSFAWEKKMTTAEFLAFTGMRLGQFQIQVTPGQINTIGMSFTGKKCIPAAASIGTGAATAANTNSVLNAIDHVQVLREGATPLPTFSATSLQLTVNAGTREQEAIANLGLVGVGIGTIGVEGSLEMYFETRAMYEKYTNFTTSGLAFRLYGSAGEYVFDLPSIKYTSAEVVIQGKDGDLMARLGFQAFRDATLGFTVGISRAA
jgi:hypothetical protein